MDFSHNNSTVNLGDGQLRLISTRLVLFMLVVNFFIGIPLNIYVIILLTRAGGLDESVFFSVSHLVSEIIYAFSTPVYIQCVLAICYVLPLKFFNGFGMIARFMFLCLVCVERYMAVVHPVTFLKFKPLKYRLFCLIVAWIYLLTCSITNLFVSDNMTLDFVGVFYSIIVIVEIFCGVSILKVLKQPAPGKREDSGMSSTKKKAFRIVLINLLTHLVQLLPLVVTFILNDALSLSQNTIQGATALNLVINIAGGLIPPLFFLHRAGKLTILSLCHLQK